jgi:hypothetical protein
LVQLLPVLLLLLLLLLLLPLLVADAPSTLDGAVLPRRRSVVT